MFDVLYRNVVNYVTQNPVYAQGYSRYLSEAKRSEEGVGLSTDNESVFKREIQRIYEVLYNAFMIDKYQEMNQANNASVTINNILELYRQISRDEPSKQRLCHDQQHFRAL